MEGSINKIDAQQNSRMAVLEHQVKDLKEELSRVTQEENERLREEFVTLRSGLLVLVL